MQVRSQDPESQAAELLDHNLPGPAPWYWKSFPVFCTQSGERLTWSLVEKPQKILRSRQSRVSFAVLRQAERPKFARLALATYSQPFVISKTIVGICSLNRGKVTFTSVTIDSLAEFPTKRLPFVKDYRQLSFIADAVPISSFVVPGSLPAGVTQYRFPDEFRSMNEFLLPIPYESPDLTSPAYQLLSIRPQLNEIHAYPQYWFTREKFDIGYAWITRARRDPVTGRIFGDGIRVSPFRLADDNCHLDS